MLLLQYLVSLVFPADQDGYPHWHTYPSIALAFTLMLRPPAAHATYLIPAKHTYPSAVPFVSHYGTVKTRVFSPAPPAPCTPQARNSTRMQINTSNVTGFAMKTARLGRALPHAPPQRQGSLAQLCPTAPSHRQRHIRELAGGAPQLSFMLIAMARL